MNCSSGGRAVELVVEGRILRATLANPPDNRLTPEMIAGLDDAITRLESPDLDVLVINGSKRAFSKGFDMDAIMSYRDPSELRLLLGLCNEVFTRIARSSKLTVAAMSGACMGGGLELALACHLRVCAENSRLGLPEIWLRLIPGLGGFYRLSRLVGPAKALELAALGDLITAKEALRLNLVNRVFPQDGFADGVEAFVAALRIADQKAIRHLIQLAACSVTQGEDANVSQAADRFVELVECMQMNQR